MSIRKNLSTDRSASIEGLPLQLMIMGIIASLGTAVIVGWISSIQTPTCIGSVEFEPEEIIVNDKDHDGVFETTLKALSLRVLDTAGNPVKGANVILEGASICNDHHRLYGKTNDDGVLIFKDVAFRVIGDRTTTVTVSVSGQGITSDYWAEIIVLPE
ncbi:MAG: hypothetical protein QW505_06155 [Thermoplasmata archaeon]